MDALRIADRLCFLPAGEGRIGWQHQPQAPRPRDPASPQFVQEYMQVSARIEAAYRDSIL